MGRIRIQSVVAFSSQDERHPVENFINNSEGNISKKWLSSPFDKSRELEAELQLECSTFIQYADIGNSGSCVIILTVGSSTWPKSKPFIPLLQSLFTSDAEVTDGSSPGSSPNSSPNSVKMFNQGNMNAEAVNQKFDRVKVICQQPYTSPLQFGISFLNLRNNESCNPASVEIKPLDFYSKLYDIDSMPPLAERVALRNRKPFSPVFPSRGRQMVDIATSAAGAPDPATEVDAGDFEIEVTLFLTSKNAGDICSCLKEYEEQFEESKMIFLTTQQKDIFKKVYLNIFPQQAAIPSHPSFTGSSSFGFPKTFSSTRRKGDKKLRAMKRSVFKEDTQDLELDNLAFDVDFTAKKRRNSRSRLADDILTISPPRVPVVNLTGYNDDPDDPLPIVPLVNLEEFNPPPCTCQCEGSSVCSLHGYWRAEDFIQPDGSMPSTSKDSSYVDCPICSKEFHISVVETHAASCNDYSFIKDNSDDDDDDTNQKTVTQPKNVLA